jgi:hypothetical protein
VNTVCMFLSTLSTKNLQNERVFCFTNSRANNTKQSSPVSSERFPYTRGRKTILSEKKNRLYFVCYPIRLNLRFSPTVELSYTQSLIPKLAPVCESDVLTIVLIIPVTTGTQVLLTLSGIEPTVIEVKFVRARSYPS